MCLFSVQVLHWIGEVEGDRFTRTSPERVEGSYFEWRPSTGNWKIWKQTLVEAPAGGNHLTVELMNGGLIVCWVYWKRMIFIATSMFNLPQCTGGLHYALVTAADIVLLPIDSLACRSWTGRVEICDECNLESCEAKGRGVDCPVYSHKAGWCNVKLYWFNFFWYWTNWPTGPGICMDLFHANFELFV